MLNASWKFALRALILILIISSFSRLEIHLCFQMLMQPPHMLKFEQSLFFCFAFQLRQTVFQFAQKELAPKAAEIDRENGFKDFRVQ